MIHSIDSTQRYTEYIKVRVFRLNIYIYKRIFHIRNHTMNLYIIHLKYDYTLHLQDDYALHNMNANIPYTCTINLQV